jgi:hypothetical protein
MVAKKSGLDYRKCTFQELRGFVQSRGLKMEKGTVTYTAALELANRDATFRFQHLPGELRNKVYFELLLFREADKRSTSATRYSYSRHQTKCHPQILATCKSIHEEARSILYGANSFNISVLRHISSRPAERSYARYFVRAPMGDDYDIKGFERYERPLVWPSALLRFENIRIRIVSEIERNTNSRWHDYGDYYEDRDDILQSFVSLIQRSTALMTIVITDDTWEGSDLVQETDLLKQLYPLARLCANHKCRFGGFEECPIPLSTFGPLPPRTKISTKSI